MDEPTTKRWIELSPEMASLLHEWATAERRSDKAQAELIIATALEEYLERLASALPEKKTRRAVKAGVTA